MEASQMSLNTVNAGQSAKQFRQRWFGRVERLLCLMLVLAGPAVAADTKTALFFGDSITAGYGLDPDEAYPALIQKKIDAAKLPWRVVNAGLSGETTAGG